MQIQVVVGEPGDEGERSVGLYSRTERNGSQGGEEEWVRHASGVLDTAERTAPEGVHRNGARDTIDTQAAELAGTWPPPGAVAADVDDVYGRLEGVGLEYGPAFQGLQRVWRRGEEVFAEVALGEEQAGQAGSYGVHPALLDSVLHASVLTWLRDDLGAEVGGGVRMPFSWDGVRLGGVGASRLRVGLVPVGEDALSLVAVDDAGGIALSVVSLRLREVSPDQLPVSGKLEESVFSVEWVPAQESFERVDKCGVLAGGSGAGAAQALVDREVAVQVLVDLASLTDAIDEGASPPQVVVLDVRRDDEEELDGASMPVVARGALEDALGVLQIWLSEERFAATRLVVLTSGAVAARPGEEVRDLAHAAVWGLARSAQSEHPGRVTLIDIDDRRESWGALVDILGSDEPQLAVREGGVRVPRIARIGSTGRLKAPAGAAAWRLAADSGGSLEGLGLVAAPEAWATLEAGQIRVGVRAAGLNFRDVLMALGMYPGEAMIGSEGAGVVLEVGPEVKGLSVGDWVMGVLPGGFGPVAVTDQRAVVGVPDGWSFAQAASVPIAFLTAYHALVDLAGLQSGESVLVHAAAGGSAWPRCSWQGIWERMCLERPTRGSGMRCGRWAWTMRTSHPRVRRSSGSGSCGRPEGGAWTWCSTRWPESWWTYRLT